MIFGENKISIKQRAKDGVWIYEDITWTNSGIFKLLETVDAVIFKAELQVSKHNVVEVESSKKKKPSILPRM